MTYFEMDNLYFLKNRPRSFVQDLKKKVLAKNKVLLFFAAENVEENVTKVTFSGCGTNLKLAFGLKSPE